jgi:RNA polymerase sigma-70 factor (ECF subfamily)
MEESFIQDDSELVRALRVGEAAAFERIVREYGGRLLAVAEKLLSNHDDALDAVQDAFLSAFRSIESFDGRSLLSTWLHRIVVNVALMKLRSKRRRPEQSIDDLLPTFLPDGHQAHPVARWRRSGQEIAEQNELQAIVRSKIEDLPDSYRIVLVLRDIEEFDTETVAQMLEITPGAVKVRLHRARQALRTLLDPVLGNSSK